MKSFHIPTLIARKREGEELSTQEIQHLVSGFTEGSISEAQMSAFAMAVYFRGMTAAETAALTSAMIHSGDCFSFSQPHPPIVDKHSTGGIGDKVSLVLAPLVACTGCWIPMVSGRGLGITGGTLDKLESIPGFQVRISIPQAMEQLRNIGVVMMGQTDRFCPADKKLYALRDVTGTVPSIPLITASIMSKKMAESLDRLVLDVKFGSGAFMKTREQAIVLADSMVAVGQQMNVEVFTEINPMNHPLGHAVGNALEVIECIEIMKGGGPGDLLSLIISQTEKITKVTENELIHLIKSGQCWEKFQAIVSSQGGNPDDLEKLSTIHAAPIIFDVKAPQSGVVLGLDAGQIGQASLELGAGRALATDSVDARVGFDLLIQTNVGVNSGDLLGRVHARSAEDAQRAAAQLCAAVQWG